MNVTAAADRQTSARLGASRLARIGPHMTMLVAAIAATVAAIVESTITSYLRVGSAEPHLLFVLAVVWTVAVGADSGLVWAFIGGLALDTLTQRPLGTTAFALLVAVGLTAAIVRPLNRLRPIAAIFITAVLSLVYSMTVVVLLSMLRPPSVLTDSLRLVAPGVVYDVVIAAILGPLAVSVHDRFQRDEERAPR